MPPIGGDAGRSMTGGLLPLPHDDPRVIAMASSDAAKSRPMPVGVHREVQLPPDASSTLFVEGLPANCSRREVARILHYSFLSILFLHLHFCFVPLLSFSRYFPPICWLQGSQACFKGI